MARPRVSAETVEAVWLRDLSRCFICCTILHRGQGGYSIHHRRPGGMGGSKDPAIHTPANLLLLCGSGVDGCHGWVERNREEARTLGYLISRLSSQLPQHVRAKRWGQHWVFLEPDGLLVPQQV